jgi:hypothetical protein
MQIQDLCKTIEQMTSDELLAHVRAIRLRREVIRPAAAKHVERVEKKASRGRVSKVSTMLDNLSPADQLKLIELLKGTQ